MNTEHSEAAEEALYELSKSLKSFYKDNKELLVVRRPDHISVELSYKYKELGHMVLYTIGVKGDNVVIRTQINTVRPQYYSLLNLTSERGYLISEYSVQTLKDFIAIVSDISYGIIKILDIKEPINYRALHNLYRLERND